MEAPTVRVVKVRLMDTGQDDAGVIAELLERLLPRLSEGRCQVGEISDPYPNRRGSGARRYLDLYLLDAGTPDGESSSGGPGSGSAVRTRQRPAEVRRGRRALER